MNTIKKWTVFYFLIFPRTVFYFFQSNCIIFFFPKRSKHIFSCSNYCKLFSFHLRAMNWIFSVNFGHGRSRHGLGTIFDHITAQQPTFNCYLWSGPYSQDSASTRVAFQVLVGIQLPPLVGSLLSGVAFSALLLWIVYLMGVAFAIRRKG